MIVLLLKKSPNQELKMGHQNGGYLQTSDLPGVPGIATFIGKNIEPLIF
jgi:hypothetical protein